MTTSNLKKNSFFVGLVASLLPIGAALGFLGNMWLVGPHPAENSVSETSKGDRLMRAMPQDVTKGNARESEVAAASGLVSPPAVSVASPLRQGGLTSAYSLQAGAFLDPALAGRFAALIARSGGVPTIVATPDASGRVWHSVRLGEFADESPDSIEAATLLGKSGLATTIVSTGPGRD